MPANGAVASNLHTREALQSVALESSKESSVLFLLELFFSFVKRRNRRRRLALRLHRVNCDPSSTEEPENGANLPQ